MPCLREIRDKSEALYTDATKLHKQALLAWLLRPWAGATVASWPELSSGDGRAWRGMGQNCGALSVSGGVPLSPGWGGGWGVCGSEWKRVCSVHVPEGESWVPELAGSWQWS